MSVQKLQNQVQKVAKNYHVNLMHNASRMDVEVFVCVKWIVMMMKGRKLFGRSIYLFDYHLTIIIK